MVICIYQLGLLEPLLGFCQKGINFISNNILKYLCLIDINPPVPTENTYITTTRKSPVSLITKNHQGKSNYWVHGYIVSHPYVLTFKMISNWGGVISFTASTVGGYIHPPINQYQMGLYIKIIIDNINYVAIMDINLAT